MTLKTNLMSPLSGATRAKITDNAIVITEQQSHAHPDDESSLLCSACGSFRNEDANGMSIFLHNNKFLFAISEIFANHSAPETLVPFSDILWLQPYGEDANELEIDYVKITNSKKYTLRNIKVHVENEPLSMPQGANLAEYVRDLLFPHIKFHKLKIMVLINPHGGQGRAVEYFNHHCKPTLDKARVSYDFVQTEYYGHAVEIARNLDLLLYDAIVCLSGDGIPHEVINGLYLREDRVELFDKLIISQFPCGSGNAMAVSCFGTVKLDELTLLFLKSSVVRTDAMAVSQGTGQLQTTKLSFLSQTYGIIADSDIGTEWLRWMGPVRFDLGVAVKVFQRAKYPCEIHVKYLAKEKHAVLQHYEQHVRRDSKQDPISEKSFQLKYPSLQEAVPHDWEAFDEDAAQHLGIFYVGKMPMMANEVQFFPLLLPNDGTMDLVVTDARTKLFRTAEALLSLDKGTHVFSEHIQHSKILLYRLVPTIGHSYISVDGETFPFEPFQVEVVPGLLKVLMTNGRYQDTGFAQTARS